jgi:hypothetical protein
MRLVFGRNLRPGAVFAHLLVHPVDVADDRLGALDPLAVHRHEHAQHAVRGRMLRPEVEHERLAGIGSVGGGAGHGFLGGDHGW